MAEPHHRSESSFPRKRVQQPIICFCFELSKNLLFECNIIKYGPILSVEHETIIRNMNLASNYDYNHGAIV